MKNATKSQLERLLHEAMRKVEYLVEENQLLKISNDKLSAELTAARNFEWRKANSRAWGHH